MTEKEIYYVGFGDGQNLRRSILEAAKATVYTEHSHSRLMVTQEQKLKIRTELAATIKQVKEGLEKLQNVLPYRETPQETAQPKRKIVSDHKLDKIESALHEIEIRMRTL